MRGLSPSFFLIMPLYVKTEERSREKKIALRDGKYMECNGIKRNYSAPVSFFSSSDALVELVAVVTHFIRRTAYVSATRGKITRSFHVDFTEETSARIQRCARIRTKITIYVNPRVIPTSRNFTDDPYAIR